MTNLAIQMEEHREQIEREKKNNPNYVEEKPKPKPMKVWHVPVEFLRIFIIFLESSTRT